MKNLNFLFLLLTLFVSTGAAFQVKILCYNVQYLPISATQNGNDLLEAYELRSSELISRIRTWDYDIILLQEVWRGEIADKFENELLDLYPYVFASPRKYSDLYAESGLLTLSKWPLLRNEFIEYTESITLSSEALADKGVTISVVNVNGTKIVVGNTHMQAFSFTLPGELTAQQVRTSQLNQIKQGVNKYLTIEGEDTLAFVGIFGDYNIGYNAEPDSEYNSMIELLGVRDLFLEHTTEPSKLYTCCEAEARSRLDYGMAFNEKGKVINAETDSRVWNSTAGTYLSDHWSVEFNIEIDLIPGTNLSKTFSYVEPTINTEPTTSEPLKQVPTDWKPNSGIKIGSSLILYSFLQILNSWI